MTAAEIARALGGARREGREWRCRCPLHGGRSLLLRDGADGLLAYCHGGCDDGAVYAELRRRGLVEGRTGDQQHRQFRYVETELHQRDDAIRTARALTIWREAMPAAGTIAETYLRSRGIVVRPPPSLRFHPRCPHPSGVMFPALVALVQHVEHGPVAIHRTFLKPDGSGKVDTTPDKASLGPVSGGAIRLGILRAGQWLAIGEGIETTLSVMQAGGLPGWAALSAGGIRSLVLPPEARMVVICADNDLNGVGQRAAHDAAERWLAEGRRVRIAVPSQPGDFNDLIRGMAYEAA